MAINYVRDTGKIRTLGTGQTSSGSFASTPTTNNLIVVAGTSYYATQNNGTLTASDNQSNTYSNAIQVEDGAGNDQIAFIKYTIAANASGTFTVTCDASGVSSTYYTWAAIEFSGITTTSPLDQTASAAETSGSTSITTSTTATLSQANELVISCLTLNTGQSHGSISASGYTSIMTEGDGVSGYACCGVGYKTVSSTTGVNAAWTWTTNDDFGEAAVLATFKGGTSGPTISSHPTSSTKFTSETAGFSVTATGTGTLTYQWKVSTDGSSYSNVSSGSGGTTSSYTTATLGYSDNADYYKCTVTDDIGSTDSNAAFLTVIGAASGAWLRY